MKLLGRIVCMFKGHKRGKRNADRDVTTDFGRITTHLAYECPRCGRETRYKVKPKSTNQTSPTDGSPHFREQAGVSSGTSWTTLPASADSAARAYRESELKKLRGEA